MLTRVLLLLLIGSIAGCAASPELPPVGTHFRDYDPGPIVAIDQPIPLAMFEVHPQGGMLCTAETGQIEAFIIAAQSNSEALEACSGTVTQLEVENRALVAAGRLAEREAELFRRYAIDTGRDCRWITAGAVGASGFLMLVLGLRSL